MNKTRSSQQRFAGKGAEKHTKRVAKRLATDPVEVFKHRKPEHYSYNAKRIPGPQGRGRERSGAAGPRIQRRVREVEPMINEAKSLFTRTGNSRRPALSGTSTSLST